MSDISVIGLGLMGSALARALVAGKHKVTVWNRSPAKMTPLVQIGASGASSVGAAIAASPLIVVCIDNYAFTYELLGKETLSGKTLIQLSTGTPNEAREAQEWARGRGAGYLDGAIMEYPNGIGTESALLLMSGPQTAYARAENCLKSLAGGIRYLGENIAGAAALDMALLSKTLGMMIGVIHGSRICEAEGIDVEALASVLPQNEDSRFFAEIIHRGSFADPGATMKTWYGALQRIERQARDAGINGDVPAFIASLFKRGLDAGYGNEDMTALIKVLRQVSKGRVD